MKNSDEPFNPQEVMNALLDLLWDHRISQEIDHPIDLASNEFQINVSEPVTQEGFNRTIMAFVMHIYGRALRLSKALSDREALAEAIHLLMRYSDGEGPNRYGAILSRVVPAGRDELEKVLVQLSQIIKTIEREKYIQWVFTCHYLNLDWAKRCLVAAAYKELNSGYLTAEASLLSPEQIAEYFQDFFQAGVQFQNLVRQDDLDYVRGDHESEEDRWANETRVDNAGSTLDCH